MMTLSPRYPRAVEVARVAPPQPTSGRWARVFVGRMSGRPLAPWADAGVATAAGVRDDLMVADGLATGPDRLVHVNVLSARHELLGAA